MEDVIDIERPIDGKSVLDGFAAKDLERWSLLRAIRCVVKQRYLDGVEAEIDSELRKRREKTAAITRGFLMPAAIPIGIQLRSMRERGQSFQSRALDTSTGAGGIPTILDVSNFIDLLRTKMVVQQMGATFLPETVGNLDIPRRSGATTGYWVADNNPPTASNQTIDEVSFTPQTVAAYTDISRKFYLQSSVAAEQLMQGDLAAVLGRAVETAALNGLGSSNQPLGIMQDSSIATIALGTNGGVPTFADVVSMEDAVAANNADIGSLGYVTNAKVRSLLKRTLRSSVSGSRNVWEGTDNALVGEVNLYPAMATNAIPSNLTKGTATGVCSAAIFGNWNDLVVALWGSLDILVNPYGNAAGNVRISGFLDCDIHVRHEESFLKITDILA
jgi:HK97 family phage major capsid protein